MNLEDLREEWAQLWERCPYATPFQSPEWLIPWWDTFHPGRLRCIVRRAGGRLTGFAPLYEDAAGVTRLIGAGITDYCDVLVEPGCGVGWIYSQMGNAELQDVRPESPLLEEIPHRAVVAEGEPCLALRLPANVEEWRKAIPKGIRRNIRRYGSRLGELEFHASADPACLEHLLHLHGARWRELRGEPGVLADDAVARFHRSVAAGFAQRGWLRFWTMRAGGEVAAVVYAFACRGRAYFYLSGFDPALAPYSPGTLCVAFAIESAINEGLREVDFLRGDEPYKLGWGAQARTNRTIFLGR